jgi:hypothetical protein
LQKQRACSSLVTSPALRPRPSSPRPTPCAGGEATKRRVESFKAKTRQDKTRQDKRRVKSFKLPLQVFVQQRLSCLVEVVPLISFHTPLEMRDREGTPQKRKRKRKRKFVCASHDRMEPCGESHHVQLFLHLSRACLGKWSHLSQRNGDRPKKGVSAP